MIKATVVEVPIEYVADVLGFLDPNESALVTYVVPEKYRIEFDYPQVFDKIFAEYVANGIIPEFTVKYILSRIKKIR